MIVHLGTLNHLLSVTMKEETPLFKEDEKLVYVEIVAEEHSGIPGDRIMFRMQRDNAVMFLTAFNAMVNKGV